MTAQPEIYNYRTERYEEAPDTFTDANAVEYIPQYTAAQMLYKCHRKLGKSVLEAMAAVLTTVIEAHEVTAV